MTGPLVIDVTQPPYNCAGDTSTDNTAGLQAAVDAAGALAASCGRTVQVYIPGATGLYLLKDTIWVDYDRVEIVGDGRNASVIRMGYPQKNCFMFGYRRNGVVIGAEHRPDAYGVLDSGVLLGDGPAVGTPHAR